MDKVLSADGGTKILHEKRRMGDAKRMESKLALPNQWPDGFEYTDEKGLTEAEAAELLAQGLGSDLPEGDIKPFRRILFDNFFTLFHMLNFALAVCLFLVGSYTNMLFITIILVNIMIGTVQEYRAQQTIRKLQLLNAPEVKVLREGEEKTVLPGQAVKGDLVVFRAGDQIIADAIVVDGEASAMEALLTGESDPVPKKVNSWLYSGSYITEGKVTAQLVYVADESYAGRLTGEALNTTLAGSMLMNELNRLIRFDSFVLVPLGILLFCKSYFIEHDELTKAVPNAVAAMIGMIPEGLILLTSIAMAVGVMKLAKRKALVQELAGIETLARADVLCLDKTGTITSGEMSLDAIEGVDRSTEDAERAMSRFLGAFDDPSPTMDAIREKITPDTEAPKAVVPFSSARKKSAASFKDGTVLIMGAPEFVLDTIRPELQERISTLTGDGKRVLVLAAGKGIAAADALPAVDEILGLIILTDQIRHGAQDTLRYFREQGVDLKVISGDNPTTVSRVARQAGLENWDKMIDARELDTPEKIAEACDEYTVFGRVTPEQKKLLVTALKAKGHSVGMTGDGVNDIPALKTADCSICMAGGAEAARHAAQLTLLDSDFSVMPDIVLEGRRVINNITRAASLFLTKTLFSFLLGLLTLFLPGGTYPFEPVHLTLISSLTVGIPGFFLALEPSTERVQGSFLKTVLSRALPGGIAVTLCGLLSMMLKHFGWDEAVLPTLATLSAGAVGFTVLLRTCLPLNWKRIVLLAGVAVVFTGAVLLAMNVSWIGDALKLKPLDVKGFVTFLILAAFGVAVVLVSAEVIKRRSHSKDAALSAE